MTRKLDVKQTAALCMEMSGNLSRQLRTYLKTECGVDIESRSKVTAYLQTAYFPNETGKVTVPDPKKKGQTKTASFLRVNPDLYSVLELLQKVADQNQEAGRVSWPANVPSDEWWIQLLADKGGGCTKLVLKMICIVGADSVRRVVPIGLLDGVSDTREMVELAFGVASGFQAMQTALASLAYNHQLAMYRAQVVPQPTPPPQATPPPRDCIPNCVEYSHQ